MRYVLGVMLFFCLSITAYADSLSSLTLTDAEMQKLKKYFPADDTRHLVWKGDPIEISVPVNKEKRIVFPGAVTVDVKSALMGDQLRIVNNDKSLYLTALKAFPATRIYVTLKDSGEVVLMDLVTDENASNTTQQIDIKQNTITHTDTNTTVETTASETLSQETEAFTNNEMSYADLIRFAWQEVYAPKRLIQNSLNIARAPMHTEKFVSDLVYGDKVIASPESAWVSGNHYVTAISIRNKYPHKTHIDIGQDICGDWQAGVLYPNANLKAYGGNYSNTEGDSAMLFLVSNRPFGKMLGVCHGDA